MEKLNTLSVTFLLSVEKWNREYFAIFKDVRALDTVFLSTVSLETHPPSFSGLSIRYVCNDQLHIAVACVVN